MKPNKSAIALFLIIVVALANIACEDSTSSRKTKLPEIPVWWAEYGNGTDSRGYSIVSDLDGRYVAAGGSESEETGDDIYLVKVDSLGGLVFEKSYGSTGVDLGEGICIDKQGDYVICGRTTSYGSYDLDAYLLHTDDSGNSIWYENYVEPGFQFAYSVLPCDDGGYVISAQTEDLDLGKQALIAKFDANGTEVWRTEVGGPGREACHGIIRTDDGYMIAGVTESFGNGMQIYLVKFDDTGKFLWEQNYGGEDLDIAIDLANADDNGCWIAGYTRSKGAGSDDGYILHVDSDGNLKSDYTFGGYSREVFYGATATSDGGCVAVGETYSESGVQKCYAVRLDNRGRTVFEKSYYMNLNQQAYDVAPTIDGGFVMTGKTLVDYNEGTKLFILKINSRGETDLTTKITEEPPSLAKEVDIGDH